MIGTPGPQGSPVGTGGISTAQIADGAVTNAKVSASAGIVGSKLNFATTDASDTANIARLNAATVTFAGSVASNVGLLVKEIPTEPRMGTLVLNGATEVTVATTAVTATSRIFLTVQEPGGTPSGIVFVSSRVASTSFGVKGIALDTSVVAWIIVEPAP